MSKSEDTLTHLTGGAFLTIGAIVILGSIAVAAGLLIMVIASVQPITPTALFMPILFGGIGVFSGFMMIMAGRSALDNQQAGSQAHDE